VCNIDSAGLGASLDLPIILVVEDDPLLQRLAEEALGDGGFETTIVAAPGEEAVTLLRDHKGKYRALATDINLKSKMDGWEVA
jgi:CheY-like chemotaxis protein